MRPEPRADSRPGPTRPGTGKDDEVTALLPERIIDGPSGRGRCRPGGTGCGEP